MASKLSKSLKEARKTSAVSDKVDTNRIKSVEGINNNLIYENTDSCILPV